MSRTRTASRIGGSRSLRTAGEPLASGRNLSRISAVVATSAYLAAMSNRFTACDVAQRSYTASCGTKARKL